MSHYAQRLTIGVVGILTSTVAISYLIQKIFNEKYEDDKGKVHRFVFPSLVTWMGCLFCSLYGMAYAHFTDKTPNRIPLSERFRLGALFTLNYLPTTYALLFISYPIQVVAKNTRYILVVIVGVFFSRVKKSKELKLPRSKILIALVITFGAGLFMYYDLKKVKKESHHDPGKKWIGFLLLLAAITFDALFSDSQAYCKAMFKPSQNQLFLAANLYGFMLIFLFALFSGQLVPSLQFLMKHPSVQADILLLASLQVVSQISVYYVISNFKQHIYPLISTVRKLFTIVFSIFIFKHQMHVNQWVSIGIVFVAMGYQMYDEVQSQEYHRRVRKERKDRESGDLGQSSKEGPSSKEDLSSRRGSQDSIRGLGLNKQERGNYHMGTEGNTRQDESLSKYSYGWRQSEIIENRQTSLSPDKDLKTH